MKSISTLKTAWESLPDSSPFVSHFSFQLGVIEEAQRSVAQAEATLARIQAGLASEIETLNRMVDKAAAKDWSAEEIRRAGL